MNVLVHPCHIRGLVEIIQWICFCNGQPLLQRNARLEMMLLDVILLCFSKLIFAKSIFNPVVKGSHDTQLVR